MAYDALKALIRQYIKTNGNNDITGQILQNVLVEMVNNYPDISALASQTWVGNNFLPKLDFDPSLAHNDDPMLSIGTTYSITTPGYHDWLVLSLQPDILEVTPSLATSGTIIVYKAKQIPATQTVVGVLYTRQDNPAMVYVDYVKVGT